MSQYKDDAPAVSLAAARPSSTLSIVQGLQQPCTNCRLGQLTDRSNNGFSYLGSLQAKLAFLGDMPDVESCATVRRQPLAGSNLNELERWWRVINSLSARRRAHGQQQEPAEISFSDILIVNTVQCRTMKTQAIKDSVRSPFPEEIEQCFPFRALPVLRSMSSLRCVVTLGWTAAGALLGHNPEPKARSHEGCWFGTDLLPGVAVFCLDHVREYIAVGNKQADPKKIGRLMQHLTYLHNELINPSTRKVLHVLQAMQATRG